MKTKLLTFLVISISWLAPAAAWSPDYMIIGAQKAGTTALLSYIYQHPHSLKTTKDEIFYFDKHFHKNEAWYRAHFPPKPSSEYKSGDKSPDYLLHPSIAERVHKRYPGTKIIVVLRNPIDRAYSQFWFNKRRKVEPLKTFEEAIEKEPELIAGEIEKQSQFPYYISWPHRRSGYLARSRYAEQIKRWLDLFPREQIMVIDSSDLRRRPQEVMQEVFAFIHLAPFTVTTEDAERNSDYPPMKPQLREKLIHYFRPYNEDLEILLNRTFDWNK